MQFGGQQIHGSHRFQVSPWDLILLSDEIAENIGHIGQNEEIGGNRGRAKKYRAI